MADNKFSTGKVHVDVNVGVNISDVKVNTGEFKDAGKDAANAFNDGYKQAGSPDITPPKSGGRSGGKKKSSGPSQAELNRMANTRTRSSKTAYTWQRRYDELRAAGADKQTLNTVMGVKDATATVKAKRSIKGMQEALVEQNKAVFEAEKAYKNFFGTLKKSNALDKMNTQLSNGALRSQKIADVWTKRQHEIESVNKKAPEAQIISNVAEKQKAVESAQNVKEQKAAFLELSAAVFEAEKAYKAFNDAQKMSKDIATASNHTELLAKKNGGIQKWTDIIRLQYEDVLTAQNEMQNAMKAGDIDGFNAAYDRYKTSVDNVNNSLQSMNSLHGTLFGKLSSTTKQILGIASSYQILRQSIRLVKSMVQDVTEIDSSMVDLKKVTDATDRSYEKFLAKAGDKARELGATITELVDSTSTFAKMGYSLTEAEGLGHTATMFANAADFSSAEEASSILIAAMRGFGLATSEADNIADKLNEVSNRYAVTATDLAEGLSRSASALSAGGNDIDQAIAMLTTIAEVTRNASEAGSALKVLSLRLRGASTELIAAGEGTDGMAESTSKLREKIAALTNVNGTGGIDIMTDAKNFKSTYQIMNDISKVWERMSDIDQAALLELIAGKVRSNQVAALLTNMAQAQNVLGTSEGSEGSVMKEHSRWLDSVEAKQKQLTASFQEFSQVVMGSGLIKGAYDVGSGILGYITTLIETIGSGKIALVGGLTGILGMMGNGNALSTVMAAFSKSDAGVLNAYNNALGVGQKNGLSGQMLTDFAIGRASEQAKTLGRDLSNLERLLIANAKGGTVWAKSLTGAGAAAKMLGGALKTIGSNLLIMGVATAAFWGISKLIEAAGDKINAYERSLDKLEDAKSELDASKADIEAVDNELKSVDDRIRELQDKGTLTFVEQGELAKLEATVAKLEAQKKAYEELAEAKQKAYDSAKEEAYVERYGDDRNFWQRVWKKDDLASKHGDDYNVDGQTFVEMSSVKAGSAYEKFMQDLADVEQLVGPNIQSAIAAVGKYDALQLSEDAKASEEWSELNGYVESVRAMLYDTLWDIDDGLAYYENNGRTSDPTYGLMLNAVREMLPVLGAGAQDYYKASAYSRALNHAKYGERLSGLADSYSSGKITEDELLAQVNAIDGFNSYLETVWVGEGNPVQEFVKNMIAGLEVAEAYLKSTNYDSLYERFSGISDIFAAGNDMRGSTITEEQYRTLTAAGEEYAACVENINGTLQLNYEKFQQIVESKYAETLRETTQALEEEKTAYVENLRLIEKKLNLLEGVQKAEDHNALIDQIDALRAEAAAQKESILGYDRLTAQIKEATSAYNKWKQAHDGKESGTIYDDARDALKDLQEGKESGRVGTDEYKRAQEFLLGDRAYETTTAKLLNRYLTEDATGVVNFQKDLAKLGYADASGRLIPGANSASIAKGMGISEELVNAIFMKANEYIADDASKYRITDTSLNASEFIESVEEKYANALKIDLEGADEAEQKLNEIARSRTVQLYPEVADSGDNPASTGGTGGSKGVYYSIRGVSEDYGILAGEYNAGGTSDAKAGIHMVDEKGAELIEHVSTGTYEVGTNGGPRMVKLGDGDIVHTAEETKKILARKSSRKGKKFSLGTGLFKGTGSPDDKPLGNLGRDGLLKLHILTDGGGSGGGSGGGGLKGGANIDPPNDDNSNSNTKGNKAKSALQWAEKLVDWIPTALNVLKKKTEEYIRYAEKAIGYLAKNVQVDKAIANVKKEIEATEAAYARYMKQANDFAKKADLSGDIIKLIHQGTIDITEYDETTRSLISEYQKWYDEANKCLDTLNDLDDQMEQLGTQKMDNITTYFGNITGLLNRQIESYQSLIDVKKAYGKELVEEDYYKMLKDAEKTVESLTQEQAALKSEMDSLVTAGLIKVGSDAWYEYTTQIEEMNASIAEAQISMREMKDEMQNLTLVNLQSGMSYLEDVQESIEAVGKLQDAQGTSRSVNQYRQLISIGQKQIDNLEMQNAEILKQMEGMDVLSEKYQELNDQLMENKASIMDMKASQEEWNDAVVDLKIAALQKQNDAYQQRLNIMEALNGIEDARQRRLSVYKEGEGFVYEADQDAMRSAQQTLDGALYDLMLDNLEQSKEANNLYDNIGNQLEEITDVLTGIDFNKYYESISSGMENSKILSDALSHADLADIVGGTGLGKIEVDLSNMTLNGVNSVEELGEAIVSQLPAYILQYMHEK